ncbi:hypothetical protein CRM22_007177 [Opisthorchis felineus]|uniref:Trematode PH-like domain-containing protein n=1 Tax=Opisthorchis felineus TaxID=147828 RepID=A0A4V3SE21_OPIFE|nr:hypothetical protein CRM22_007177 [Opisthorchis felineus]
MGTMPSRKSKSLIVDQQLPDSRYSSDQSVLRKSLDQKTKQLLFFECHVCILGRVALHRDEQFSQAKADVVMKRLHSKRQSHCIAYFLEDMIRFRKTKLLGAHPARNFVTYRAIKHVFLFEDKPDTFMLCIDNGRSIKKTYEAFKCKSREDVLAICELIYKASLDSDYRLRDVTPIREFSRLSELSLPAHYHSTTELDRTERLVRSTTSLVVDGSSQQVSNPVIDEYQPRRYDSTPLELYRVPVVKTSPKGYQKFYERKQAASPDARRKPYEWREAIDHVDSLNSAEKKVYPDDWEVNVTYLKWDNQFGAVVNDCGPIYMYFARRLNPHSNYG